MGPPPTVNSRFAAAAEDHAQEREREMQERAARFGDRGDDRMGGGGGGRYGDRGDDRMGGGGGGRYGDRMGGGRFGRNGGAEEFPILGQNRANAPIIAPEMPKHLQPKKEP